MSNENIKHTIKVIFADLAIVGFLKLFKKLSLKFPFTIYKYP